MNGLDFFFFLLDRYDEETQGEALNARYTFNEWLLKPRTLTLNFRFTIPGNPPKSIHQEILIAAWDANLRPITDQWLTENGYGRYRNDCRLSVLNFLLDEYDHLR